MRSFPPRRKMHTGHVQESDVELTPLMCLFMILVPLLLVTAVFERVTALKVNLPQASTLEAPEKPEEPTGVVELQVLLQEGGMSVQYTLSHDPDGKEKNLYQDIRYDIPTVSGEYDLPKLQEILKGLKQQYPKHEEAILLVEDRITYDTIVQCMDTCREEFIEEDGEKKRNPIFPSVVLSESFSEEKGFEGVREGTREIDRKMGIR